ncbi:hypothetical protein QN277_010304 [Acacia crassicarpa]|uniref:non-specific serine/threonine protein kinase n=1 Tax=Acacia crassicarpa TaxID=499986 RepID=A0AAE1M563_9FABA|nr:hypothetical protein QN277_010304 [Acacia crassicarpa]
MWRFKPFMQKEPAGLEGRSIDVGNLKVNVLKAIAEGGFSSVYLVRDAVHMSKQYALKHMICNDEESLELVKKEISVMKSLKGHPNVVTLYAHAVLDMGRTKEAFLVMEFCEKSLANVLESRGSGYFDEKQVLLIFRDVCNAVFAMHCQSPPIGHRDLKVENLLLGPDGLWKLCDFGSTSTNHKRFEKAEEMGIEEDNIRKHTTPAYRAPEMWDLFLREVINEKVDIWALGCLLFRICYFKSAFDGESKLQVLNGNYRIPDLPKYSSSIMDLIRDMLQARPDDRPDITQVWFRVNEQLPIDLQKSLPDRPPELLSSNNHEGSAKPATLSSPMPRRSPPPPPSSGEIKNSSQSSHSSIGGGSGGQLGAFWSTMHANDSSASEVKSKPIFDEEPTNHHTSAKHDRICPDSNQLPKNIGGRKVGIGQQQNVKNSEHGKSYKPDTGSSKDFEIKFYQDTHLGAERRASSSKENAASFQDKAFDSFVAEFDTSKLSSGFSDKKSEKEEALEAELENLRVQLKEAQLEKAEITSKYEKLSAICRSQRQEIQDLKQTLAARTPSPKKESLSASPTVPSSAASREKVSGTIREVQQNKAETKTPSSESKSWQAFPEEPQQQKSASADSNRTKSVRTRKIDQNELPVQPHSDFDAWGFGTDNFTAVSAAAGSSQMPRPSNTEGSKTQAFGKARTHESKSTSQPSGWAGF